MEKSDRHGPNRVTKPRAAPGLLHFPLHHAACEVCTLTLTRKPPDPPPPWTSHTTADHEACCPEGKTGGWGRSHTGDRQSHAMHRRH